MSFRRRQVLVLVPGAAALALFAAEARAATSIEEAISAFTAGRVPLEGRVTLTAPSIAENGNSVPLTVSVESPMSEDDFVEAVTVFATGNPNIDVATFQFSPASGQAAATTRIRLAKTQDVVALARMSDGSVYIDRAEVKVTLGGCGG